MDILFEHIQKIQIPTDNLPIQIPTNNLHLHKYLVWSVFTPQVQRRELFTNVIKMCAFFPKNLRGLSVEHHHSQDVNTLSKHAYSGV